MKPDRFTVEHEKIPVSIGIEEAKALADEVRMFILNLLSEKPCSVQEIAGALKRKGFYKNNNTLRYHLRLLKSAGLIELVKTEEVKGGVLKYYASKRKVYPYEVPKEVEKRLEPLIEDLHRRLKPVISDVIDEHRDLILETAKMLKPCPYCITEHFAEYVIVDAVRRALGRVLHDPEVSAKLSALEEEGGE